MRVPESPFKDRELRLKFQMIPKPCWWLTLSRNIPKQDWDKIRYATYMHYNYKCEICGGVGNEYPVICHTEWEFDDKKHIQRLIGFSALCPMCSLIKHIGLARKQGKIREAEAHFCQVNNVRSRRFQHELSLAYEEWDRRNRFEWEFELSPLDNIGIDYTKILLVRA